MIILFGSGYIGQEFRRQLESRNIPVFLWENARSTTFSDLDKFKNCSFVINAAGVVGKPNVDACELNKEETIRGNVVWPSILTDWCVLNNIPLGHVSSGCIYSGGVFTEEDEPNFAFDNGSFYSGTKVLAEKVVMSWSKSYVWRLRMPFEENDNSRNYLSKLITYKKLLNARNSISNKQEFVHACIEMMVRRVPYGIYNVTNTGFITTSGVVELLKKTIAKNRDFEFVDEGEFYEFFAKTPRSNCVLSNEKLLSTGIPMRDVWSSIEYCLNNWN
jgi:dTDP-4-dehydrorhamnose reductase